MEAEERLLGRWISEPADVESLQVHGTSIVDFEEDGVLVVRTHPGGQDRVVRSPYRIEGSDLLLCEGSVDRRRVAFRLTPDGCLVMGLGEGESRYVRARNDNGPQRSDGRPRRDSREAAPGSNLPAVGSFPIPA